MDRLTTRFFAGIKQRKSLVMFAGFPLNSALLQGGPLPIINRVITPIKWPTINGL